MPEPKTLPNQASVADFLASVPDPVRRADAERVCAMVAEITGEPPVMWGPSIIGFGQYHYQSPRPRGASGEWMLVGVSPRKAYLSLYLTDGIEAHTDDLARLGKHTTGKGCLYIKKLADVDEGVLREIIAKSAAAQRLGWGLRRTNLPSCTFPPREHTPRLTAREALVTQPSRWRCSPGGS